MSAHYWASWEGQLPARGPARGPVTAGQVAMGCVLILML